MADWCSTSLEQARETQERHGWSDEQLVARMLAVLRSDAVPDLRESRTRLEQEYDALPAQTPVSERVEHLARVLPALSGPWATTFLTELLTRSDLSRSNLTRSDPAPATRTASTGAGRAAPYGAPAEWRRGLLIMLATWLVLVVLAVGWVWLRPSGP